MNNLNIKQTQQEKNASVHSPMIDDVVRDVQGMLIEEVRERDKGKSTTSAWRVCGKVNVYNFTKLLEITSEGNLVTFRSQTADEKAKINGIFRLGLRLVANKSLWSLRGWSGGRRPRTLRQAQSQFHRDLRQFLLHWFTIDFDLVDLRCGLWWGFKLDLLLWNFFRQLFSILH